MSRPDEATLSPEDPTYQALDEGAQTPEYPLSLPRSEDAHEYVVASASSRVVTQCSDARGAEEIAATGGDILEAVTPQPQTESGEANREDELAQDTLLTLQRRCNALRTQLEDREATIAILRKESETHRLQLQQFEDTVRLQEDRLSDLFRKRRQLEDDLTLAEQDNQKLRAALQLPRPSESLPAEEIARLQGRLAESEQALHDADSRISTLLSEIEKGRTSDGNTTSLARGELQPGSIRRDFITLGEQEFDSIAREAFRHQVAKNPSLKAQRWIYIAHIKSQLLAVVFTDEEHRIEREEASRTIQGALTVLSDAPFSSEAHRLACALRAQILTEVTAMEESLGDAFEEIVQERILRFEGIFSQDEPLPDGIREDLRRVMKKAHQLLVRMRQTTPPGHLVVAEPNALFDADQHDLQPGCEEGDFVSLTLYPGYNVGTTVFAKALVSTRKCRIEDGNLDGKPKDPQTHHTHCAADRLESDSPQDDATPLAALLPERTTDTTDTEGTTLFGE